MTKLVEGTKCISLISVRPTLSRKEATYLPSTQSEQVAANPSFTYIPFIFLLISIDWIEDGLLLFPLKSGS